MNLHIGGREKMDGWKILNIQPGVDVDFIGDISNLEQFEDASIDNVYASHVLEHVRQADLLKTLIGIKRILKPGGLFLVSVPDWDILCHLFISPVASAEVKWHAVRMMLGGQVDENDFHYVGFNQTILFDFLGKAGFTDAIRVDSFGMFADTSDFKPYGYPISLNVTASWQPQE